MRRSVRLAIAVCLLVGASGAVVACSDDEGGSHPTTIANDSTTSSTDTTVEGISEEEAIEIATEAMQDDDPDFDVAATRPSVLRTAETYDVAFVPVPIEGPGGEPHIVVDRISGEVTEIYHTK